MKRIIFFFILLFITSCSSGSDQPDTEVIDSGFVGGIEGLKLYALDGAPPSVITDSATFPFSVIVAIENVGESPVGQDTFNPLVLARLAGIQPKDFSLSEEDVVVRLDQKLDATRKLYDGTALPGELNSLEFTNLLFKPRLVGDEIFTPVIEICYDYSNHANLQICMKDDILESYQDDTLCRLRSKLLPRNSGGPIQVVEADQNPRGDNEIQFNFVVQNVGAGVVFNRVGEGDFEACNFNLENKNVYKALVVVYPVDDENYDLDCRGLDNEKGDDFPNIPLRPDAQFGVVRLRENSPNSITCFLEKVTDVKGRVFQDLIDIDIYYRYGEFLEIPILIQEARGLTRDPI